MTSVLGGGFTLFQTSQGAAAHIGFGVRNETEAQTIKKINNAKTGFPLRPSFLFISLGIWEPPFSFLNRKIPVWTALRGLKVANKSMEK